MLSLFYIFFFYIYTATPKIYTLFLHDALPISCQSYGASPRTCGNSSSRTRRLGASKTSNSTSRTHLWTRRAVGRLRSEEHTSELQSHSDLVCRLLLEKKKKKN